MRTKEPAAVATGFGSSSLERLLGETVALYQRLRWEAERIHGGGEAPAGRRGVLRGLQLLGPQTVPQMARARPVSRQYIQALVNGLAADGLVRILENPAHKRSVLFELTEKGRAAIKEMDRREQAEFRKLRGKFRDGDLDAASATLRSVRMAFENGDRK